MTPPLLWILEIQSEGWGMATCSILIAMYEMHGQLIIISTTTATQSNKNKQITHKKWRRTWIIHKNLLQKHIALKLKELAWITILMYVHAYKNIN